MWCDSRRLLKLSCNLARESRHFHCPWLGLAQQARTHGWLGPAHKPHWLRVARLWLGPAPGAIATLDWGGVVWVLGIVCCPPTKVWVVCRYEISFAGNPPMVCFKGYSGPVVSKFVCGNEFKWEFVCPLSVWTEDVNPVTGVGIWLSSW